MFLFHGCMQPLSTPVKITSSAAFNSSSSQPRIAVSRTWVCFTCAANLPCNPSAWWQLLYSCHWWRPRWTLLNNCKIVQHTPHVPPSLHSNFDLIRFVSFCLRCFNHNFLFCQCLSLFLALLVWYFKFSILLGRTIRWCTVQPWQHSICLNISFIIITTKKMENFERILLSLYTPYIVVSQLEEFEV